MNTSETIARTLRKLRHGILSRLPEPAIRASRNAALLTLQAASLGRGRRVMVAGEYPLSVLWERMAVDFETWEAAFTREFGRALARQCTVFDIGASFGEWSALAATLVGSDRVHIFEPNRPSWTRIRRTFRVNRLTVPAGLFSGFAGNADRDAETALRAAASGRWPAAVKGTTSFEYLKQGNSFPVVKLDTYCQRLSVIPDVIKIDVEGAEGEVLRGAEQTLKSRRPVLFLSLHPWAIGDYGDTKATLLDWVASIGYRTSLLSVDHEEHWHCLPK